MRAISIAHRLPKQSSKEGRANHFFGEQGPPQLFPIQDVDFKLVEGSFGWRADAPICFWEEAMGHLTLREALASRQLDAFVREQQDHGAELVTGSELERGLALLVTQHRIQVGTHDSAAKQHDVALEAARIGI
jgi:hypothetical protein